MRIAAGELDRRITILRGGKVDNGMSTVEGPPVEIGKRWAKKTDVSDGERMRAGQFGQGLSSRFLVRSDSLTRTLSGADIIECAGRRYAVSGGKESGEREDGIEITTSTAGKPA